MSDKKDPVSQEIPSGNFAPQMVKTWRSFEEKERLAKESLRKLTRYDSYTTEVPPSSHKFIIPYGIHYKQEPRVRVQMIIPKEEDSFTLECNLSKIGLDSFTVVVHNSRDTPVKAVLQWESFLVSQV